MTTLADLFEIPKWKSARQLEVEARYLAQGIDFEPIFYEALRLTLRNSTPPEHRGRGFMSQTMNGHVIGVLRSLYPDRMRKDDYNRCFFLLDKETRIYFKKLDKRYRPNNILTKHVAELNSMSLLLEDEPITVLYAGFRLKEDMLWDDLHGCYLLEMKDLRITNWVSDLGDLGAEMATPLSPVVPVVPVTPGDFNEDITVTIKTTKEDGRTAESTDQ